MSQKIPLLKVDVPILRHARDVYTEPAFDMFQYEYEQSLCMIVESCIQRELVYEYRISLLEHSKQYKVTFVHAGGLAHCSCKTFEFVGILCGHVIKVLDDLRIKMMIPEHFILKRWTKQARAGCAMDVNEREIIENPKLEMSMSYNFLCSAYVKLVGKAVVCEEARDLLARNYAEVNAQVEKILTIQSPQEHKGSSPSTCEENMCSSIPTDLLSTGGVQVNGLKKRRLLQRGNRRYKSCLEKGSKKRKVQTQVASDMVISTSPPHTTFHSLEDSRHSNELLNDKHGYFEGVPPQSYTEMLMGDDTSYDVLLGFMSSRNNEVE
ncbi:protein FAR1-RELATED SEQUENCE 3-like [Rhododendron vialii]|uniref:protein FAR1-RELATED SEQUENCE 3-like n=1 Tax=Rhododendron vialii TaxID=182163 RepID=UPI00265F992B|nr:protein FAR1-RELATED SEQUENCE 3-like [Rhododendron vialii]